MPPLTNIGATVIYALLGIVIFTICFKMILMLTPFSVRKEIEEDQNVALAVIIGSTFIGMAIIIAAAIVG